MHLMRRDAYSVFELAQANVYSITSTFVLQELLLNIFYHQLHTVTKYYALSRNFASSFFSLLEICTCVVPMILPPRTAFFLHITQIDQLLLFRFQCIQQLFQKQMVGTFFNLVMPVTQSVPQCDFFPLIARESTGAESPLLYLLPATAQFLPSGCLSFLRVLPVLAPAPPYSASLLLPFELSRSLL